MKRLLAVSFLFSLLACGPLPEKIQDRTGGCVNGSCVDGIPVKPSACNSNGTVLTEFIGRNFSKTETSSSGVEYIAEYRFTNGNTATHIVTCTKGSNWTSVQVDSSFSYHAGKKILRFDKASQATKDYPGGTCAAALTNEEFAVSYEGVCLVLTDAKRVKRYFPRN